MRHYRFYILFVAVLTLSGCADFLDRDPLEQASANTFWKTEADVEKGVNALYPLLPGERDFWRDCESDNSLMTNSWGENGLGYICQGIHNAATGYLSEEWKYDHIYRILYCMDKLQGMEIKEEKNTTARTIGTMAQGQLCYILADKDSDWVYIESGDVRGFVEQKYLDFSDETKKQIEANGEDKYQTAKETVKPEENQALYYTLTSVKEGSPSGEIRESMLEFASQFIGNPYVWGGTSLTDGADCSGFVMSVFANFGYELPRVAAAQYEASQKKDISQMETGDLVFYGAGGINHVALYIGDGKVVHALNSNKGIVITDYNYDTPVGVGTYVK